LSAKGRYAEKHGERIREVRIAERGKGKVAMKGGDVTYLEGLARCHLCAR